MDRDVVGPIVDTPGGATRITAVSVVLFAVAIALIVVGFAYFTTTSAHLPAFMPGHYEPSHAPGHVAQAHKHRVKLGLLSFGLALVAAVDAWYAAAPEDDHEVPATDRHIAAEPSPSFSRSFASTVTRSCVRGEDQPCEHRYGETLGCNDHPRPPVTLLERGGDRRSTRRCAKDRRTSGASPVQYARWADSGGVAPVPLARQR